MTETDILYAVCGCLLFAFAMAVTAFIWLTRQSRIQRLLDSDMPAEQKVHDVIHAEPVRPADYGLALGWTRLWVEWRWFNGRSFTEIYKTGQQL